MSPSVLAGVLPAKARGTRDGCTDSLISWAGSQLGVINGPSARGGQSLSSLGELCPLTMLIPLRSLIN